MKKPEYIIVDLFTNTQACGTIFEDRTEADDTLSARYSRDTHAIKLRADHRKGR